MRKQKRSIALVSQYFHPLKNPPAKRLHAFARWLSDNYEVAVITGQPNYPDGKLKDGYTPFFKRECLDGIRVYRYPEIPLPIDGGIKPIINYSSFALSLFLAAPRIARYGMVLISSPPFPQAIIAFALARLFRKKIMLDIRDLWPESAAELRMMNRNGLLFRTLECINRYMIRKADHVITISETLCEHIKKEYHKKHVSIVTNFAKDPQDKQLRTGIRSHSPLRIVFTGIITRAQALDVFLEKFDRKAASRRKYRIDIIGDGQGRRDVEVVIKKRDMHYVRMHGYRSKEYCDEMIRKADIGLITLDEESPLFRKALPSKFFEYIAHGKPVIANTSLELKKIIQKHKCGWFLQGDTYDMDPTDIDKKAEAAVSLFHKKYKEEKVRGRLIQVVRDVE
ncbi:MAG: glycosyltransferase family 4 protein [Nanoarchaeota archaeon]